MTRRTAFQALRLAAAAWLLGFGTAAAPALAQDPAVDQPQTAPAAPSLDDLPEDFPIPKGTSVESDEARGQYRTLTLAVQDLGFADLVNHFERQLPEKNFRVLNQTRSLPLPGFDRASGFTVRARNGAVFGLLVVEKEGRISVILEGRF